MKKLASPPQQVKEMLRYYVCQLGGYSKEVESAKKKLKPVLALESTIISHGMPFPQSLDFALEAESTCKSQGVTPATVAIIDGTVCVGLEKEELDLISSMLAAQLKICLWKAE